MDDKNFNEEKKTDLSEKKVDLSDEKINLDKDQKVDCDTCYGKGQVVISCCSGEVINDDYAMCPTCKEHLGEEDCPDCDGTGKVDQDKTDFADKIPGLGSIAEARMDAEKYNGM